MGFTSKAVKGGWVTWGLAPPSTAKHVLVPTGGRVGGSFLGKTLSCSMVWRLFLASSRRWTECGGRSLLWLPTILPLGLEVAPSSGPRLCRCPRTVRSSCSMGARVNPVLMAVVVAVEDLGPGSGVKNLSLEDEPGGDGL